MTQDQEVEIRKMALNLAVKLTEPEVTRDVSSVIDGAVRIAEYISSGRTE